MAKRRKPVVPALYVRVSAETEERWQHLRGVVEGVFTVTDFGYGTAMDAKAAWFELAVPPPSDSKFPPLSASSVRKVFVEAGTDPAEVRLIDRGEGKLMARQLDLLGGAT